MFDFNDFGFTTVNESELEAVQQATAEKDQTVGELSKCLIEMYDAILPLLNNLKGDSSKDYIYWPATKRVDVINKFIEDKLNNILDKAGVK